MTRIWATIDKLVVYASHKAELKTYVVEDIVVLKLKKWVIRALVSRLNGLLFPFLLVLHITLLSKL